MAAIIDLNKKRRPDRAILQERKCSDGLFKAETIRLAWERRLKKWPPYGWPRVRSTDEMGSERKKSSDADKEDCK